MSNRRQLPTATRPLCGIGYDINPFLHYRLVHRKDGQPINESER